MEEKIVILGTISLLELLTMLTLLAQDNVRPIALVLLLVLVKQVLAIILVRRQE
jgi:hypothetical protein